MLAVVCFSFWIAAAATHDSKGRAFFVVLCIVAIIFVLISSLVVRDADSRKERATAQLWVALGVCLLIYAAVGINTVYTNGERFFGVDPPIKHYVCGGGEVALYALLGFLVLIVGALMTYYLHEKQAPAAGTGLVGFATVAAAA